MKNTLATPAVVVLGAWLAAACSGQPPVGPSSFVSPSGAPAPPGTTGGPTVPSAALHSTVPVQPFPSGAPIPGTTSTLVRNGSGISITVHTSGLEPGAYTAWWVVFNDPSACVGGCGLDDLGVATVLFATGHVVGTDGSANFAAHLSVGDITGLDPGAPPIFDGPGLLNPIGADVHLVLRTHGAVIPGRVAEQIGTFTGGCDVNACANVQVAVHAG